MVLIINTAGLPVAFVLWLTVITVIDNHHLRCEVLNPEYP